MVAPYLSKALLVPQRMLPLHPLSALRHHCRRRRPCWCCCYRVPPAVPATLAARHHLQSPSLPASLLQLPASLSPCCNTCSAVSLSPAAMLQHLQHDATCSTCNTCRTTQPAFPLCPCLPAAASCLHASPLQHLRYSLPASLLQFLQCSLPASLPPCCKARSGDCAKVEMLMGSRAFPQATEPAENNHCLHTKNPSGKRHFMSACESSVPSTHQLQRQ